MRCRVRSAAVGTNEICAADAFVALDGPVPRLAHSQLCDVVPYGVHEVVLKLSVEAASNESEGECECIGRGVWAM